MDYKKSGFDFAFGLKYNTDNFDPVFFDSDGYLEFELILEDWQAQGDKYVGNIDELAYHRCTEEDISNRF